MDIKGKVSQIETFGLADGPGVRFVIFMQGCNMRCKYCHNPETRSHNRQVTLYGAGELIKKALRYKSYQKDTGGITVSGGEPLCQMDFVTELFKEAKKHGVHTALDTSLQPFSADSAYLEKFNMLMAVTDLFLVDIKAMDENIHKDLTGCGNKNILEGAKYLSSHGKAMWLRRVLVPNLTDGKDDLNAMKAFADTLNTVERIQILPYHTLGISKWEALGMDYPLKGVPAPTEEEIARAEAIFNT